MKIHCLEHVGFEGPAYIQQWAEEKGFELIQTPLYLEEIMPSTQSIDMLVVMGGPMSVGDVKHHPWLREEKEYLINVINAGIPVLGICLGAQLIADVLGARVYRNREKEIGWFEVELTPQAIQSRLFQGLPARFTPYHWHGDTFDIPEQAHPLATNLATVNQGFFLDEKGKKVVALQFHLESTPHSIHEICTNAADELKEAGPYIQTSAEMQSHPELVKNSNTIMKKLLDNMTEIWNNRD